MTIPGCFYLDAPLLQPLVLLRPLQLLGPYRLLLHSAEVVPMLLLLTSSHHVNLLRDTNTKPLASALRTMASVLGRQ